MDEQPEVPLWWRRYAAEFPGWQAWQAISGLLYARKLGTSPPLMVRGEDAVDLRDEILRAEAKAADADPAHGDSQLPRAG